MKKKARSKLTDNKISDIAHEALLDAVDAIERKYPVRIRFNIDEIKVIHGKKN